MPNSAHRNRKLQKSGFALAEMVGTLTLVSIILSLSAVVLNQAFNAHRSALAHFRHSQQLHQFGDQFRRDIHLATSAFVDETTGLVLQRNAGKRITYQLDLARAELIRSTEVSDKLLGKETWPMAQVAIIEWNIDSEPKRDVVRAKIIFEDLANRPPMEWLAVAKEKVDEPSPSNE